ncbi:protein Dok-7 isoform X3 [Odocoileus virginianus]|uniref:Protein Dok-7 isoform X3 n=1 Tax=Odocoileus virginianus TaxID=9874 RepID=A0ABM4HSU7_ODOVR
MGRSLLPVLHRGRPDQLSVRLHCPRHLAHQGSLRAAACSSRPEPWGPRPGGKGGAGGPGSPAAGEAAQPPLSLRPAGQRRGRPQRVQLVVRGQPLGRQRQQPARAVAGAVLVLGQHVAGGPWAGGLPGLWGRRAGRCQARPKAAAAAAAAGGRPPELLGQRHRHWQPLLLLGQLLVVCGQQPGRVAGRRRARLPAQPAGGRGPRARPVRLPTRGGRVPGARRPAAALRHAPQPAPGAPGPAPRRAGQPRQGRRPGLRVSPWLAWRETAGTGARGGSSGGRRALGSWRPPRWAPSRALFHVSRLRRTEGKAPSLRVAVAWGWGEGGAELDGEGPGSEWGPACREGCVLGSFGVAEPEDLPALLDVRPRGLHLPGPPHLLAKVAPTGGPSFEQDPEAQGACWLAGVCSWDPGTSVAHSQWPPVGRERQGLGSRVGSPRTIPPPLLAEPRACSQDQKAQGGDFRSPSGAPGTACALGGSLLTCMDFGCVACCVPWRRSWFQTPRGRRCLWLPAWAPAGGHPALSSPVNVPLCTFTVS